MNWQAISFDWNQMRAFLAAAEEGSLTAAARALGATQPTIGRQIAALEAELGVALIERAGRSITLTGPGLELLEHGRAMAAAATQVSLAASGQAQSVDGLVRVTASDVLCAHILPRAAARLAELAPRLEIELVADNAVRDLMRREADIAIRHVRPDQPDLIARMARKATAHFYASTTYLERRGRPQTTEDLAEHDFISFGDIPRFIGYLAPLGIDLSPRQFRVSSASGVVAWELAKADLGVAVMSDAVAASAPHMERLLPDGEPFTFPVWLATHRELHTSRRIRLVFDFLAEFLTEQRAP